MPFDSVNKHDEGLIAKFGDNRAQLKLTYAPLKAELYIDNLLAITANDRGLLNFEHLRVKPAPPPAPPAPVVNEEGVVEGEQPQEEPAQPEPVPATEELENAWEEHFSSHHDSKPNGIYKCLCVSTC